jgi:fanconi anemia group J protein
VYVERVLQVHDIEDLMKVGKLVAGCPYYASRKLAEQAELVFCPYNYIVDPFIRKKVDIHLKGNIIIFDEAHNIEDTAREAASIDLTLEHLLLVELDAIGDPASLVLFLSLSFVATGSKGAGQLDLASAFHSGSFAFLVSGFLLS